MKSTRHITTSILAALGTSLVFASAHAQSTAPATTDATPSTSAATPADPSNAKQYRGKGSGMEHGKGQGKQHGMKGQRSEISKLMTPEERTQMRNKMQAAKTPEERQAIRTSMRAEMQKRAKEKGITLPEGKGGQKHRHGAHSG